MKHLFYDNAVLIALGFDRLFRRNHVEPEIKHDGVFHRMTIEEIQKLYNLSGVDKGLDSKDAEAKLLLNGPNVLPPSKSALYSSIIRSFFNGFGPILWFACVFSFILYQPLGGDNPVSPSFSSSS